MLASLKLSLPPHESQGFARKACAKEEAISLSHRLHHQLNQRIRPQREVSKAAVEPIQGMNFQVVSVGQKLTRALGLDPNALETTHIEGWYFGASISVTITGKADASS
jgi:hypothetical protein